MSGAAPPEVTVLVDRLEPQRGMERAALRLVDALRSSDAIGPVEVVCLRGTSPFAERTGLDAWRWLAGGGGPGGGGRGGTGRRSLPGVVVVVGVWATAAFAVSPRRRGPHVAWEHSVLPDRLADDRRLRLLARIARPVWRRAGEVIVVSGGVAATVEASVGRRSPVIPNLMPVATSMSGRPVAADRRHDRSGSLRLLSVGALLPFKGHDLLLDVLEHELPSATATILGEGPQRGDLERRIERGSLRGRVELPGHVAEVAPHLARADVLVHLSRYETFGLAALEAAEAGVPVVSLDVACLDEVVPELVPGRRVAPDPRAVADAVREVVAGASAADRAEAQVASRRRAERFDPETTVASWVQVIQAVARPARGATA